MIRRKSYLLSLLLSFNMIRIFNKKTNKSILIDETLPHVHFSPLDYYEDNPHILFKIEGLNLGHHSRTCEDCGSFLNAFGTNTCDWYIDYSNKINRLNLTSFGQKPTDNQLTFMGSAYFTGTILRLNIDTDTVESLEQTLKNFELTENYESCSLIVRKLNSLKNE